MKIKNFSVKFSNESIYWRSQEQRVALSIEPSVKRITV